MEGSVELQVTVEEALSVKRIRVTCIDSVLRGDYMEMGCTIELQSK